MALASTGLKAASNVGDMELGTPGAVPAAGDGTWLGWIRMLTVVPSVGISDRSKVTVEPSADSAPVTSPSLQFALGALAIGPGPPPGGAAQPADSVAMAHASIATCDCGCACATLSVRIVSGSPPARLNFTAATACGPLALAATSSPPEGTCGVAGSADQKPLWTPLTAEAAGANAAHPAPQSTSAHPAAPVRARILAFTSRLPGRMSRPLRRGRTARWPLRWSRGTT